MPGHVPSAGMLMTKLVSLFPHNSGTSLPTHQALILVFDPDTGEPLGLLDGTVITAVDYAEALDGADIAAAATHAVEPVVRRSWLTPGVHVTSVGFSRTGSLPGRQQRLADADPRRRCHRRARACRAG
ncbi:hypothetical protein OG427_01290 [Streptomyces sp. NBC_00133]